MPARTDRCADIVVGLKNNACCGPSLVVLGCASVSTQSQAGVTSVQVSGLRLQTVVSCSILKAEQLREWCQVNGNCSN